MVVYKADRLTRSLADFAKLVERMLEWLQTPEQLLAALRDETVTTPLQEGFYSRLIMQAVASASLKTARSFRGM